MATEDVVLSGVTVRARAGDSVFVNTQAANRDENVFDEGVVV